MILKFIESDGRTGDKLTIGNAPIDDGQVLIRSGKNIIGEDSTNLTPKPHNLLSDRHPDTYSQNPTEGSIITGQNFLGSPKWVKMLGNITTEKKILNSSGDGVDAGILQWEKYIANVFRPIEFGDRTTIGANIQLAIDAATSAGGGIILLDKGEWNITSNLSFATSNILVKFINGAYLKWGTGITITFADNIDAVKQSKIFQISGTGVLSGVNRSYVTWFGAIRNLTVDSTTYLQQAFDWLYSANGLTLIIPEGSYKITSAIIKTGYLERPTIIFEGKSIIYTYDCSGISLQGIYWANIQNVSIIHYTTASYTSERYGLRLNGICSSRLLTNYVDGFKYGVYFEQTSESLSAQTNVIDIGEHNNNLYAMYIKNSSTGYFNANVINCLGQLKVDGNGIALMTTQGVAYSAYGIYMTPYASPIHGNAFNNLTIEGGLSGINAACYETKFDISYLEMTLPYMHITGFAENCFFRIGNSGYVPEQISLIEGSNYNIFTAREAGKYTNLQLEELSGGIGFVDKYCRETIYSIGSAGYLGGLYLSTPGASGALNKNFDGTAAPTTGTYIAGAVVWNTAHTSGQPNFWICTRSGTAGTLTGVTGTGTLGENHIVVNNIDNIYCGCILHIYAEDDHICKGVDRTNKIVYFYDNLTEEVVDQAITYVAPIFTANYSYVLPQNLIITGDHPKITLDVSSGGSVYDFVMESQANSDNPFNLTIGGQRLISLGGTSGNQTLINAPIEAGLERGVGLQYAGNTKFFVHSDGMAEVTDGDLKITTSGYGIIIKDVNTLHNYRLTVASGVIALTDLGLDPTTTTLAPPTTTTTFVPPTTTTTGSP